MAELIKNIEKNQVFRTIDAVSIEPGRVNSLTLSQTSGCKMTLLAIDEGEGMSSHSAPGDAFITVLEGTGEITVEGKPFVLQAGDSLVMPAGAEHAVRGVTAFKMLLVVVKEALPPMA